jgi:predicted CopG family antitoxin
MPNITLSIPDETHRKMKQMSDVRWSEVARRAIEERISDFEALDKLASKSKITDKDIEEISKKIKRAAGIRFNESSNRHQRVHLGSNKRE